MGFVFDHLVHYVENPKEVIGKLAEQGIHVVEGGVHEKRGTFNTLSYFDLSYIEFLGAYDQELVEKTEQPKHSLIATVLKDQFTEGFARIAIRTTDIEGVARSLREKGLTVNGPVPLSRKRPDGSVIEWQLLYAGDEKEELELPFIIQWNEGDEERRKDSIERGVISPHPSGAKFSHVAFAVKNLEEIVENWSNWLNVRAEHAYTDEKLNARCQVLQLEGGNLLLCQPIGDGIVSDVLTTRGEKPFQVVFSHANENKSFELHGGFYEISK